MKRITKMLLIMAIAMTAVCAFGQNTRTTIDSINGIPVYPGIHLYPKEIKDMYIEDQNYLISMMQMNMFDMDEVQDIFTALFKIVSDALEEINKKAFPKKEGMIVVDQYGRRIYISLLLRRGHYLLEGGDIINGIFYPIIITINGVHQEPDKDKPWIEIPIPRVINFNPTK